MLSIRLARPKRAVHRVSFASRDHLLAKQLRVGSRVASVIEDDLVGTVRSMDDRWVIVDWDAGLAERVARRGVAGQLRVSAEPPRPAVRRTPVPAAPQAQVTSEQAPVDELDQLLTTAVQAGVVDEDEQGVRRLQLEADPGAVDQLRAQIAAADGAEVVNADPAEVRVEPEMTEAERALAQLRAGGSVGGSMGGAVGTGLGGSGLGGSGLGGGARRLADVQADRLQQLAVDRPVAVDGSLDDALEQLAKEMGSSAAPPLADDVAALAAELAGPTKRPVRRSTGGRRPSYVPPERLSAEAGPGPMDNLNGLRAPLVVSDQPFRQSLGDRLGELGWTTVAQKR